MGTSSSVSELAGKLRAGGRAITYGSTAGVNEAALQGKAIIVAALPTRTMSNVGANGARLGAFFRPAVTAANPTALLAASGPVPMAVGPIRPHAIYPRGLRVRGADGAIASTLQGRRLSAGRRGGTTQGLRLPDGNVRLFVNHPGVARPPTEVWWAAVRLAVARNHHRATSAGTVNALRRVFV